MVYNEEARNFIATNLLQSINEAYFGKTDNVKKIIEQIGIIRRKAGVEIGGRFSKINKYHPTINTWPETIKLNRLIEETFGFEIAAINVSQEANLNAYTYPISYSLDIKDPKFMITSTKTGFKYKKEAHYCLWVNITSGLFLNGDFTDEEITALLFHEIGHNFSTAMDGELGGVNLFKVMFNWIYTILNMIITLKIDPNQLGSLLNNENWIKTLNAKWNEFTSKYMIFKGFKIINNSILILINAGKTIVNDIIDAISSFTPLATIASILSVVNWPAQIIRTCLGGTRDEQYADAFAGTYGLGTELSTAIAKMGNGNHGFILYDVIHNTPVIGHIANAIQFPLIFMTQLFDEHPNLNQRFRLEIELCEKELQQNNLDPKLKAELNKQLKELNKEFEKCCSVKERIKVSDPHILQRKYEEWLHDRMGGGMKTKLFDNDTVFNKIDDTYRDNRIDKIKFR